MFFCIEQVPDSTECEIQNALESCDWDVDLAVKELKIGLLMLCPPDKWKIGLQKNRQVCGIALNSVEWNLDLAMNRVQGIKSIASPPTAPLKDPHDTSPIQDCGKTSPLKDCHDTSHLKVCADNISSLLMKPETDEVCFENN